MIFLTCPYSDCDELNTVGYEAGDEGAGRWVRVLCEKCKRPIAVQLVSIGGEYFTEEEFLKLHPEARKEPI